MTSFDASPSVASELKVRVALITGAANNKGIGMGAVRRLAELGCDVAGSPDRNVSITKLAAIVSYGDDGRQRNTALLEYKLQTAADSPIVRTQFVEIATDGAGPRGAKGIAEAPNRPTAGAVANAITRITGRHVNRLPMTPQRVWETMR